MAILHDNDALKVLEAIENSQVTFADVESLQAVAELTFGEKLDKQAAIYALLIRELPADQREKAMAQLSAGVKTGIEIYHEAIGIDTTRYSYHDVTYTRTKRRDGIFYILPICHFCGKRDVELEVKTGRKPLYCTIECKHEALKEQRKRASRKYRQTRNTN